VVAGIFWSYIWGGGVNYYISLHTDCD
jgi:hypothetical protein